MHKFAAGAEQVARLCAALAGAVFLLSGTVYLYIGHWTVTHQDFWDIYDVCLNHTWIESALLKHNGHSLFFPSFLWLADLRFFHGNQQLLFFAGLVGLFITAALLLVLVWRDETVGLTAKIMSTLAVIVGNFWMARAHITASGGFNWTSSLLLGGAELAFICLSSMRTNSRQFWPAALAVVLGGFVASFSFGAGLATWPALLFLAWCLRLPWRSFGVLAVAALAAAIIFILLPPPWSPPRGLDTPFASVPALSVGLGRLCRMLGAPIFYAASGWYAKPLSAEVARSSFFVLWFGALGLTGTVIAMASTMVRRDLTKSSLELIGMAMVTFNIIAMVLVVTGRADHFRALPFEVVAPRYLFFSTLFWTGLLLVAIQRVESKQWLRWPVYIAVLALPVVVFPTHYKDGLNWRWARYLAESGATSLINGVRDERQIGILAPASGPEMVYRVAEELRVRRLDMFAEGLQDWIGVYEARLFGGRHQPEGLEGQCTVSALVDGDDGAPAACVTGRMWKRKQIVPRTLIIVGPTGVVCGIARSSAINSLINRTFYLNRFPANIGFLGYIRDYDSHLQYSVHSADEVLSDETIPVQPDITNLRGR